jgi:hypothetical protein
MAVMSRTVRRSTGSRAAAISRAAIGAVISISRYVVSKPGYLSFTQYNIMTI